MNPSPQLPSIDTSSGAPVGAVPELDVVVSGSSGTAVAPGPVGRGRSVGMLESGGEQVPKSDRQLVPQ